MKYKLLLLVSILFFIGCDDEISIVDSPDTKSRNSHYVSNRAPLQPSKLIKLPVGSVKPEGWLLEYFNRQKNGLTGNLGKISAWLDKKDNAWLSKSGEGKWGWEEVPYWLKGYANIGYITEDKEMIDEAKIWIESVLNSQREDGYFGPEPYVSGTLDVRTRELDQKKRKAIDFWPNMIMLYCLQSYYEYSNDQRVIDLMTNYFKFQLDIEEEELLSGKHYWDRIRGGDNLHSVIWLYNRTGEKWLLELAEKVYRRTAPWTSRGHDLNDIKNPKDKREGVEFPDWFTDLIDWHNVNIAQGFRTPAQYYLLNGDEKYLNATYENFNIVRDNFGQVPGGMFGGDENSRPGYDDPRQGIELCGVVEQMNSDEHLLRITGDIFWADHLEEIAFNSYPATVSPDFKAVRYITSPNMVLSDSESHGPGIANWGPFLNFNPFSSRCCQHNHTQGWPYFTENLWMATPDNGLAAVVYAPSIVNAKVGDDTEISINNKTKYPFEDNLLFEFKMDKSDIFPIYFRIPSWAENSEILINGKKIKVTAQKGKYLRINRKWSNGDLVNLNLPKTLSIKTWEKNHSSVSLNYGPLTFSLKIKENYVNKRSDKSAISDSKWQKDVDTDNWPTYEIYPGSPWNYGLILKDDLNEAFEVVEKQWPKDNFPFTNESSPIYIKARAKKIESWKIGETKLVGELMDSPVESNEKEEIIELVPMGTSRLRISSFPVIKN
ncbi:MAG: beta-L-arabinofuranosidase domain-containing protein [Flavobacteriaceae bacterium]